MALQPGFDITEAIELLEICSALNTTQVSGDPDKVGSLKVPPNTIPAELPKPQNWTRVYQLRQKQVQCA